MFQLVLKVTMSISTGPLSCDKEIEDLGVIVFKPEKQLYVFLQIIKGKKDSNHHKRTITFTECLL